MYTKEVSINDGSGDGQRPKVHFCPLTSWKYILKQRIFLFIRKSLVGQGLSWKAWQWQWQASEFPAGRWGKFKGNFFAVNLKIRDGTIGKFFSNHFDLHFYLKLGVLKQIKYPSMWIYENQAGKHFVIFLNFPCLIACLHCCLLMSFVFACFVVTDLCRSGCIQNYYLPPPHPPSLPPSLFFFVPTHNSLFNTSDFIWNQCAPKAGFGAV